MAISDYCLPLLPFFLFCLPPLLSIWPPSRILCSSFSLCLSFYTCASMSLYLIHFCFHVREKGSSVFTKNLLKMSLEPEKFLPKTTHYITESFGLIHLLICINYLLVPGIPQKVLFHFCPSSEWLISHSGAFSSTKKIWPNMMSFSSVRQSYQCEGKKPSFKCGGKKKEQKRQEGRREEERRGEN